MTLRWCFLPHIGHPLHSWRALYFSPIPVTWCFLVCLKMQAKDTDHNIVAWTVTVSHVIQGKWYLHVFPTALRLLHSTTILRHRTPNLYVHIDKAASYGSVAHCHSALNMCSNSKVQRSQWASCISSRPWATSISLAKPCFDVRGHPSAKNYFLNESKAKSESNANLVQMSRHHKTKDLSMNVILDQPFFLGEK